ncbi:glycosyltransferase family 4 protein [Methylobacterium platani]|uniref:Glycosyl transferase n=2 Tax=Methylobacterium platani TaxID=427683 RepID=A0A179SBG4_9HYPH|nr:glycosyltransferase family 4 protein [Methylobacterium platani]KMO21819.1 glycosyl transferase [Methylobacterium platani JCM 14648]OAS24980.1 glycosyl transferase [Methylobacterium platani]
MRIAQVAPLAEAVPPKFYGGTERVVSWLTEELVRQGHDVTLFASGDSETSAKLVACCPEGLRLAGIRDHVASHLAMLYHLRRRADEFDVIHFHIDLLQYPLFEEFNHKCVTTLHGRLDVPDFMPVYRTFTGMPLVSISDHQRGPMPENANWLQTIHHGLPAENCRFSANPKDGGYLAFLGRISPEKRPDRAIEIAKASGVKLKIAAKVDKADQEYWDEVIEPMTHHPLVEYIGEINEDQKHEFLGNALALAFPIDWPEPFGLVMIEAMSAGTPVIAWRNGSVPEVIKDGVSGVVVESMDEAIAAVETCKAMSREGVRRYFETRFTASVMARSYVAAYESLLAGDLDAIKIPGLTLGAPAALNGAANGVAHPVLRAV